MKHIKKTNITESNVYFDAKNNVPNDSRDVIMCIKHIIHKTYKIYEIGYYTLNGWYVRGVPVNNEQVIAWTEIPEYKETNK